MSLKTNIDLLGIIIIAIMLVGACLITYYYTTERINKCTSDPIKFAIAGIDRPYNVTFTSAEIILYDYYGFPLFDKKIDLKE